MEATGSTIECTVTEESTLLTVNDVVILVADPDADGTDSCVACQPARIAVIPVLVLIFLARSKESALVLRPLHVLRIVCLAAIKDCLLVAIEERLLALLINFGDLVVVSVVLLRRVGVGEFFVF